MHRAKGDRLLRASVVHVCDNAYTVIPVLVATCIKGKQPVLSKHVFSSQKGKYIESTGIKQNKQMMEKIRLEIVPASGARSKLNENSGEQEKEFINRDAKR